MAGSGVMRLRLARAKGGMNPRMKNPSSGKGNRVNVNVNAGSNLDPGNKKSAPYVFQDFPTTPPPPSNEHPSRGEHGRSTRRRNSSQQSK